MDWNKLANALRTIGINEAKQAMELRNRSGNEPEAQLIINRKIIGGNICCHFADAIDMALK